MMSGMSDAAAIDRFDDPDETVTIEPDPVIDAYMRDVDLSLLRENLRRTPDERFRRLWALQRFARELQRAGREAKERGNL